MPYRERSKDTKQAAPWLSLMPVLPALFIMFSSAVFAGAASIAAPANGKVGIVFAPGMSSEEAARRVIAAGGLPVDIGAFDNIVVAWAEGPTFARQVERQGAWLTFDPQGLGGCLRPLF